MKNNYLPVIGSLLTILQSHGFRLAVVNDIPMTGTPRQQRQKAKAEIDATDESHLYVVKDECTYWIFIVLGHAPEELVCNCTVDSDLEKALSDFSKEWEGVAIPVKGKLPLDVRACKDY